jgi:tRNA (mo5U34)-methyltransferase
VTSLAPAATPPSLTVSAAEARRRIGEVDFWYHTIDVAPGVTTPGWFDLRHSLDLVPFPDVRGKRCLDVGTFDGFYAFEMERRGAAEVVAVDVPDHEDWDWPIDSRAGTEGALRDPSVSGPPKGHGFRVLADLLGSKVDWRPINIYDLDPEIVGTFDVVIVGSLLLHLQNPVKAMEAVRSVTDGVVLSSDQVELWLSIVGRGKPLAKLRGTGRTCQWWNYNSAAHRQILWSAGFEEIDRSPFFINRYDNHPTEPLTARSAPALAAKRAITRDAHQGVLHRAVLARPRPL